MAGKGWWNRAAHIMEARKQRERERHRITVLPGFLLFALLFHHGLYLVLPAFR
jgi:hypothetical protein